MFPDGTAPASLQHLSLDPIIIHQKSWHVFARITGSESKSTFQTMLKLKAEKEQREKVH